MANVSYYNEGIYLTNLKISDKAEYIPTFCINQFILRNWYMQDNGVIPIAILPDNSYTGYLTTQFSLRNTFRGFPNGLSLLTYKYRYREYLVGKEYIQEKSTGKVILGSFYKRSDLEERKQLFKEDISKLIAYPSIYIIEMTNSVGHKGILSAYSNRFPTSDIISMDLNASDLFETIPIDLNTAQEYISNQTIEPVSEELFSINCINYRSTLHEYFNISKHDALNISIFDLGKHVGGMGEIAANYVRSGCNGQNSDELF